MKHVLAGNGLILATLMAPAFAGCLGYDMDTSAPCEEESCATSDLSVHTQSILGGTATTSRPEVGVLSAVLDCSATLIGNRHVLTAAHCIGYAPQTRDGNFTINYGTWSANSFGIDRAFSQGGKAGADDLAIVRLRRAVPGGVATPASVSSTQPVQGTSLTVVGYGCTDRDSEEGFGTRRFKTYTNNGATAHYCFGDSGAPTFNGALDSGGPIVRVARAYNSRNGHDIGANPVTYRSHILGMVSAMEAPGVSYRAHVAAHGWMPAVSNGSTAGTTGESRRVEALQIWSATSGVELCYSVHASGIGWMPETCDGALAGTTGQQRQLEAVRIRLRTTGPYSEVVYNTYVAGIGWQGPRRNNEIAGTTGQGRRIEAITIAVR